MKPRGGKGEVEVEEGVALVMAVASSAAAVVLSPRSAIEKVATSSVGEVRRREREAKSRGESTSRWSSKERTLSPLVMMEGLSVSFLLLKGRGGSLAAPEAVSEAEAEADSEAEKRVEEEVRGAVGCMRMDDVSAVVRGEARLR